MTKVQLNKPTLICLFGHPGAGKSYFARNLTSHLQVAHLDADRIRSELFKQPRYDEQENAVIFHLMNYLAETFLNAGVSVVYDANAFRAGQRKRLRQLAELNKAQFLLIWIQTDSESAFTRTQRRDRRTSDDKFAEPHTKESFQKRMSHMQNPTDEDPIVISGKHAFVTQKSTLMNRLYQTGLVTAVTVQQNIAKPGLINLVPFSSQQFNPEDDRRNINIY